MDTTVQDKIVEGNKLIAEFMGLERKQETEYHNDHFWIDAKFGENNLCETGSNWCFKNPPPFNSSWSWLMPVYDKIKQHYYKTYQGDKNQERQKRIFGNIQHFLCEVKIEKLHTEIIEYLSTLPGQ